jgi:similar to stage IV sporulation protein
VGEGGFWRRLKGFFKRKGLIAGIIIISIVLGLISSRLNAVEINGLKTVERSAVMRILEAEGVKKGIYTKKIDKKHLEYLITGIDGIAFASVKLGGMTLIINVYEELPPPHIIDGTDDVPVLAKKDGVITRVIAFSGTPTVKAGDPVTAGEILIAPIENVGGVPVGVRAAGEVYAKVYYSASVLFLESQVVRSRTGRVKTLVDVELFGVPIGKKSAPPFALYEEEIKINYTVGAAPIKTVTRKYYELKAETVVKSFDAESDALIKKTRDAAASKIPKGSVVLDGWYKIIESPGGSGDRTVEYYYEAEEKIS